MLASLVFIVAMFSTMVLIPPLMRLAGRLNIVDLPDPRKVHSRAIPRIGGIAMIAAAVALILLWAPHTASVLWYVAGVGVIACFGVWDDRRGLDYRLKFLGQLLAVLCVVFGGDIYIRFLPFSGLEPVGYWVSVPLTVFALLGITNAINLADGLDGLAGGTSFISIAVIGLLAFMAEDSNLLVLCTAVLGGIVGFLRYNTHPAQVFMGDAGSQFLGFSAGVLVLILTQQTNPAISPIIPLLILGLPILDTLLVMGQRLYEGRSPFKPDKNHIHHKLLALGFDQYEAVGIIYTIQAVMVTSAVFMRYESDWLNAAWFAGLCMSILVLFRCANRAGWRAHAHRGEGGDSALARMAAVVKRSGALVRFPLAYIVVAVPGYLVYAMQHMGAVPMDAVLTLSGMLLLLVLLIGFASWRPWVTVVDRIIICTTITACVYYGLSGEPGGSRLMSLENGLFVGLVLAIILLYRYSKSRSFKASTMDFLVVFAVMVLPNLLGEGAEQTILSEVATKAVILYYAAELAIAQSPARPRTVRVVVLVLLAMFVGRALLA
jgi:UDP-GlcNAc:undecaprenyl-phosphate GlcNAc-1-phosphate transferase